MNVLKVNKKDPNYADAWIWLADRKRAQHSSFSMTNEFKYMLEEASKEIDRGLILDPEHAFWLFDKTTDRIL